MNPILEALPTNLRAKLIKKKQPSFIIPMLATLTHKRFYSPDWMYERKLDGERCLAFKKGNKVSLRTRNDESENTSYPEIVDAVSLIDADVILDGEICAFKNNVSDFSRLQQRMHAASKEEALKSRIPIFYYIFDILYLDGYDLTHLPLIDRKHILRKVISFRKPLRYVMHRFGTSESYYKGVCKKGWEGLVVKDKEGVYEHKRSPLWLKFKCVADQEMVIGGYTKPGGSRVGFGALLLGFYKNGKFHYAGKVGTGFNEQTLTFLKKKMDKLKTTRNPFYNYDDSLENITWVKPELVCEIGFEEWTKDNKLRQPRYQGLRRDKPAKDVVQEI